ncbi:MAG: ATP-binding protein [Candidatus Vogelbacteria bacterium]|nr:ATP-binding protein [Candidatus Vogelbacteria bacterium]
MKIRPKILTLRLKNWPINKNEAILASIGDGLIVTNEAGNIALVNEATEKMLGVKINEIIGKSNSAIFPMEDEKGEIIPIEKRPMTTALAGGSTTTTTTTTTGLSYYYKRLDGTKFPVSLSVTPVILDGKIIGAIDIFRDITKEKDIDKVKTEFVSLASHQLRTPLSAINWYTEMLLNGDAGVINDEQRKYLGEVSIGNKRMVALVNALLNVSRLDLGTFIIEPEPTDITAMIKSVLDELRPQITTKKLKLTETYDPKVPTQFSSDQKLLRMVFQNLLSNAVKYTPEAGSVAVSLVPKGSELVFSVADSGMGIPASQKDKIFSKLFRADNARESDSEGTGLGLYIVKSVIEQSGGKVWFESVESKGSTFFVSLPLSGMKKKEGTKKLD